MPKRQGSQPLTLRQREPARAYRRENAVIAFQLEGFDFSRRRNRPVVTVVKQQRITSSADAMTSGTTPIEAAMIGLGVLLVFGLGTVVRRRVGI